MDYFDTGGFFYAENTILTLYFVEKFFPLPKNDAGSILILYTAWSKIEIEHALFFRTGKIFQQNNNVKFVFPHRKTPSVKDNPNI